MKNFLKLLTYIFFGSFFLIIIIILRPLITIRIGKLNTSRIGHLAINTALYYIKNKKINKSKSLDLFYCDRLVANRYLLNLWRKKINILPRMFLFSIFNLVIKFKYTLKYHYADNNDGGDQDPDHLLFKFDSILNIPDEDIKKGEKILENLGTDSRKIILFFARDEAYTNYLLSKKMDIRFHSYRNANIDNFLFAAEELTKKGYALIRVGSKVSKKIKTSSKYIIDYSNSKYQSEFMDIYLQSICEFFISSGTGINEVARIFNKPILYVSFTPYAYTPTNHKNLICIYKKYRDTKTNRLLSLNEMFRRNLAQAYHKDIFIKNNIELIDNTPEEIKDAALEMLNAIKNNFQISNKDIFLHDKFWDIYYENIQKYANYRLGKRSSYTVQIGKKFLNDNLYLLDQ